MDTLNERRREEAGQERRKRDGEGRTAELTTPQDQVQLLLPSGSEREKRRHLRLSEAAAELLEEEAEFRTWSCSEGRMKTELVASRSSWRLNEDDLLERSARTS